MAIEIVDFPIKNGDFFNSYVSLPEGIPKKSPHVSVGFLPKKGPRSKAQPLGGQGPYFDVPGTT